MKDNRTRNMQISLKIENQTIDYFLIFLKYYFCKISVFIERLTSITYEISSKYFISYSFKLCNTIYHPAIN